MAFTDEQLAALAGKLGAKNVRTRKEDGVELSYLEGWYVIAEANRIFGFAAWDRETLETKCVWQGEARGEKVCHYVARIRIRVRADDTDIIRDATGAGMGTGPTPGAAHELAIKTAETDGLKRALSTFGNPFGLALYDKEQKGVRKLPGQNAKKQPPALWTLRHHSGAEHSTHKDPVELCGAVKRELTTITRSEELIAFWTANQETIGTLRQQPKLLSENGRHYAELLSDLYTRRLQGFAAEKERSTQALAAAIPQPTPIPRPTKPADLHPVRRRAPDHLSYVSSLPCVVCGRSPAHAHHIRHAQPRALGRKVSDEFTIPLCATHHRALHDRGDEAAWWMEQKIDPLKEAQTIWQRNSNGAA